VAENELKTLSDEQRVLSWHRVVYMLDVALGRSPQEFGYMPEELAAAWMESLLKAFEEVSACADSPRRIDDMAREANRTFQSCITPTAVTEWQDILPEYRLKWQFLIRHVALMFEWTADEEPIEKVESDLVDLFKEQLKQIITQESKT
jgi:hypothetical protein